MPLALSKVFVLGHPAHKFRDDILPQGTFIPREICPVCRRWRHRCDTPLEFLWQRRVGQPRQAWESKDHSFWGNFHWLIDEAGASILKGSGMPFCFSETRSVRDDVVPKQNRRTLLWVSAPYFADVVPQTGRDAVCGECGCFQHRQWRISRLLFSEETNSLPGIFQARQNGPCGPIFITDLVRQKLLDSGITGLGIYSAGKIAGVSG